MAAPTLPANTHPPPSHFTQRRERVIDDEEGSAVLGNLMAVSFSLLLALTLVNGILMLYTRATLQHAVDLGAQEGSRFGTPLERCQTQAEETIEQLAQHATEAEVTCTQTVDFTTASVSVTLDPVIPGLGPAWTFTIQSTALTENL